MFTFWRCIWVEVCWWWTGMVRWGNLQVLVLDNLLERKCWVIQDIVVCSHNTMPVKENVMHLLLIPTKKDQCSNLTDFKQCMDQKSKH